MAVVVASCALGCMLSAMTRGGRTRRGRSGVDSGGDAVPVFSVSACIRVTSGVSVLVLVGVPTPDLAPVPVPVPVPAPARARARMRVRVCVWWWCGDRVWSGWDASMPLLLCVVMLLLLCVLLSLGRLRLTCRGAIRSPCSSTSLGMSARCTAAPRPLWLMMLL